MDHGMPECLFKICKAACGYYYQAYPTGAIACRYGCQISDPNHTFYCMDKYRTEKKEIFEACVLGNKTLFKLNKIMLYKPSEPD